MATTYIPQFPYPGPQIYVGSNRVILHAKNDAIFLFGKSAISLSSPGRVNIDTKEGTTINAPEIELGIEAKIKGEPVVKALTLITILKKLIRDLEKTSNALSVISKTGLEASVVDIASAAESLSKTCVSLRNQLNSIKSKITYTR